MLYINTMKRVSVKRRCPNPLFEKWLQEWKDEAAAKDSNMQYCFGKALKALKRYPLVLKSGKECGILQNFGTRLCIMLDRKLVEYKKTHPDVDLNTPFSSDCVEDASVPTTNYQAAPKASRKRKKHTSAVTSPAKNTVPMPSPKKKTTNKIADYVPAYRSGPYALLLTLYKESKGSCSKSHMSKKELQSLAQPLCDTSFTKPLPGSYYSAWSSITHLERKGLVSRFGNPAKFSLTPDGEDLAEKLENIDRVHSDSSSNTCQAESSNSCNIDIGLPTYTRTIAVNNIQSSPSLDKLNEVAPGLSNKPSDSTTESVIFVPHTFDVIMLVDTGENSTTAVSELNTQCAPYEVRRLQAGDFMWICREQGSKRELVLPYIVERKRMDDLGKSIKDGRFHEQKFRLKQCGVKNLIYLVESHGGDTHVGLPLSSLRQAMANTQIVDGFSVHCTTNLQQTVSYLCVMTKFLSRIYCSKTLIACSREGLPNSSIHDDTIPLLRFEEFQKISGKLRRHKVREMFVKHLIQLKGLSVDKALAVVHKYPTPRLLMEAYQSGEGEDMLANILHGSSDRRIGPIVSKSLYRLYTNLSLT